jgi:hypothetical protein
MRKQEKEKKEAPFGNWVLNRKEDKTEKLGRWKENEASQSKCSHTI